MGRPYAVDGRGFTVVELLVVIAIIAGLTAIAYPVILAGRDQARKTACISNLNQLHRAISLYAGDADGYLPSYTTTIEPQRPGVSPLRAVDRAADLGRVLRTYGASADIWYDPVDPYARRQERAPNGQHIPVRPYDVNHLVASYFTSDWWYGPDSRVRRLTNPVLGHTPLDVSWWDEYQHRGGEVSDTLLLHDMLDDTCHNSNVEELYSHRGTYNCVYFDGHVKTGRCLP